MFNTQKDQLFTLIKTLTKAEKRNFKLYVNRLNAAGESKFLQLFDVIDKLASYDEDLILKKLTGVKKKHLANQKRHLYRQILTSLRLIHINKNIDIQIREQIDFARILYGKGMYMQSLRILERIKKIAWENHQDILNLEILEFQKMIETRHVTRSRRAGKMEDLLESSTRRSFVTYATSLFSNLNIQMHGWYIEHGHALNDTMEQTVRSFYKRHLPEQLPYDRMTFHEKINLYQANMWLYYILLDYRKAREFALQWLNQFETEQLLKQKDPDLYMRGLYYLLTILFLENRQKDYDHYLQQFNLFYEEEKEAFNENSLMISFTYLYLSKLNACFLSGDYQGAIELEPEILANLERFEYLQDPHRGLLFFYKLAAAYFGLGDFNRCLDHLNELVHHSDSLLRFDLLYAARSLQALCHLELENYDVALHLITSCKRSFFQNKQLTPLQGAFIKLLELLARTPVSAYPSILANFQQQQENTMQDPLEIRTLSFFPINLWVKKHSINKAGLAPGVHLG